MHDKTNLEDKRVKFRVMSVTLGNGKRERELATNTHIPTTPEINESENKFAWKRKLCIRIIKKNKKNQIYLEKHENLMGHTSLCRLPRMPDSQYKKEDKISSECLFFCFLQKILRTTTKTPQCIMLYQNHT